MAVQNAMTADFLRSAYGGESMANMRYLIWGDMAAKEGFPNVARLFRAISDAEQKFERHRQRKMPIEIRTIFTAPHRLPLLPEAGRL